ncbi:hypothetical protein NPIL_365121 [Nephila pilipes]|uniref:Uncharacterized protein n=1 Tax=Nephila pilipes TaxID=299642 RepID=A0A8X6QQL8_NEPPI|nr:hypothetical protein NPIL_365121 [Nephila pilipes]
MAQDSHFFQQTQIVKTRKTLMKLRHFFYDFFSEKITELQRKLNFHNIQYYSGENIKNFAHRLETAAEYMLAQAQTNEAKTITHSIILSKFKAITSLPQNFQRKLSSKNLSTLKEAIDIAVKMQQNSETHTTCSMLLQPVKTVNTEKDSITQKLDELTNQIANLKTEQKTETEVSQHISYRTPQQNTLPRHTVSCSFRGKPNHLMKDCWEFLRTIHTTTNINILGLDNNNTIIDSKAEALLTLTPETTIETQITNKHTQSKLIQEIQTL